MKATTLLRKIELRVRSFCALLDIASSHSWTARKTRRLRVTRLHALGHHGTLARITYVKQLLTALLLLFAAASAWSQPQEAKLRVATRLVKPFVFEQNGQLTGFSIELWREISRELNVKSEFIVKPSLNDILTSVKSKEADLGIAAISITAERERDWDFSQPMFGAGTQILVAAQGTKISMMTGIISAIFKPGFWLFLGLVLLTVAVAGHFVWFFERHRPHGMLSDASYFYGVFEACWWAASTLATQADQMPRSAVARIVAVIWMFIAVAFIAYFTAAVTSSLTVRQLRGAIDGPGDLPGKRVASVTSSTSAAYLKQHNIDAQEFGKVEDAYLALQQGSADAVVYDAPVLLYYASHEGKRKVRIVGPIFHKETYGILFPSGDPKRKPVNEALLKLKENGTYDRLYAKWFGGEGT